MKIGIDCRMYSSDFTGIGRYVYELTNHLFKLDSHVSRLAPCCQNEYVLFFNEPEYSKFSTTNPNVKKVLVNAPHYSLQEQTRFLHLLNAEKLDLMHFTHFNAPIFYNKPFVVTIHDLTLHFYPGKKMTNPFHRAAYHLTLKTAVKKAKKVITVSHNTKQDLQTLLKTPLDKIKVIYQGIDKKFRPLGDQQAISQVNQKYGLTNPYLLYTGVWRSHKNLPNLLKAFHLLKTEYNFDGYLVITGRKDPLYAKELIDHAISLQIDSDIIFTGMVEESDLVALYNGALLYVFPSFYEGFGLSPLEAMQCGTPTVVSNSSCIPEICGAGNAIYFNPKNPADIAAKIWLVISDLTLRAKLISRGLKHVKKFSWQKMASETLQVYNEALKNNE